jgi:glutamine synthetase
VDATEIRKTFDERGIRQVRVGGFDIDGVLRGKYISLEKFWSALEKGFGFCDVIFGWDVGDQLYDNATVTGWHSGYPDVDARIDPSTLRFLRYEPDTAHLLVDFHDQAGKPHPACPRNLLKRVIARAEASGYRPRASGEFEFWVFQEDIDSLHAKGFRNLTPLTPGMFGYSWVRAGQSSEFVHDMLDTLREYDIEVEGLHTETGPGVFEVAIRYDDALRAADQAALFKTTMKLIARRHGLAVTFMAKWNENLPGSSGHLHHSLWDSKGEKNLFADPGGKHGLSPLAHKFAAGQVQLMRELTACYSPFVNTYRRYVPGVWAPLNATWGIENRTCAVRAITGPGPTAARLEYRQTAADINPYIAMAASLGAGLYGIEHDLEPPPPVTGDATAEGAGGDPLPRTLADATRALEVSDAAREVLGEAFVDHYVRTRDWEVRQSMRAVTDWELRRYFEAV